MRKGTKERERAYENLGPIHRPYARSLITKNQNPPQPQNPSPIYILSRPNFSNPNPYPITKPSIPFSLSPFRKKCFLLSLERRKKLNSAEKLVGYKKIPLINFFSMVVKAKESCSK